jgi:hypothetical protein
MTDGVEQITHAEQTIAFVIRATAATSGTSFFTTRDAGFQSGFVVYPAGGSVQPHTHLPVVRRIVGTSELLLVRSGRCFVDIYTDERVLVASRELFPGDAVLSLGGGHGFRMIEPTVLLEVKQGPFGGDAEKERFDPPRPEAGG